MYPEGAASLRANLFLNVTPWAPNCCDDMGPHNKQSRGVASWACSQCHRLLSLQGERCSRRLVEHLRTFTASNWRCSTTARSKPITLHATHHRHGCYQPHLHLQHAMYQRLCLRYPQSKPASAAATARPARSTASLTLPATCPP